MIDEDDYYDSQEWADEREYALMDWDGLCEMCDEPTDSPHVHHTYGLKKQIYDIWCPECHAEHHGDPNIALYQKKQTCCKYCGDPITWSQQSGKWIPYDAGSSERHSCSGRFRFYDV